MPERRDHHGTLERRAVGLPETIQIEIDSRCNLRCPMCAVPGLADGRPPRTLAPEEFEALLTTHFGHVTHVMLCGFSEPLMNPHLPDLVRIARARGQRVNLATNGLTLTPELADRLVAAGLDDVAISIDTTRPAVYEQVRGVDRWATLVAHLRALRAAADRARADLAIEVHAVVSSRTIGEIEALLRFAAAERAQVVTLIREMPLGGQDVAALQRAFAAVDWTAVAALARDLGLGLLYTDPRPEAVARCYWASNHSYVSIDGDVSPCQIASLSPEYRFGNLHDAAFADLFAGPRYVAFRERIARGEIAAPCRDCSCVFRRGGAAPGAGDGG
jgi:radical SAM protein with 4Fe4S-binding SPASM domain